MLAIYYSPNLSLYIVKTTLQLRYFSPETAGIL